MASLESVLAQGTEAELQQRASARKNLTGVRTNHAVSYVALVERVVALLLSAVTTEAVLDELHHLFRQSPTRVREGRHLERRKELRYAHKLRFHKYVKRIIA